MSASQSERTLGGGDGWGSWMLEQTYFLNVPIVSNSLFMKIVKDTSQDLNCLFLLTSYVALDYHFE